MGGGGGDHQEANSKANAATKTTKAQSSQKIPSVQTSRHQNFQLESLKAYGEIH